MPKVAPGLLLVVDVDGHDHVGAGEPQPLDHVEPDAAKPEHDRLRAGLDLGGVEHRAYAGRHAAADIADLVERRVLADLGDRDFRQHGEIRKRGGAHVVVELFATEREPRGPIRHHALARVPRMAVQRLVLRERQDGHCRHSGV